MLWSQIKLTSYNFSDVHIAGEFLRIFSCVVTYRTGAVRHLYMKTSAGAGVVKDQPDTYGARQILHEFFTCNNEYIYIQIRHYSSKETGC